jgi:hypothetical protein
VFGALKSKGKAKWRHEFAEHDGIGCTRERGAELILQSSSELSDSVVAATWEYGEELDDHNESDSSDNEFELRMATNTDDEEKEDRDEPALLARRTSK